MQEGRSDADNQTPNNVLHPPRYREMLEISVRPRLHDPEPGEERPHVLRIEFQSDGDPYTEPLAQQNATADERSRVIEIDISALAEENMEIRARVICVLFDEVEGVIMENGEN